MPIHYKHGNMLKEDVDALVNPVNTVGTMGKGLALQFKQNFPDAFPPYQKACKNGLLEIGQVLVVPRTSPPRFVIHFPTKKHWRSQSQLSYISQGLDALVHSMDEHNIQSIALPALGCGLGGLAWPEVRSLIENSYQTKPDVHWLVFEPS
jgi:O-acetyl-ADP-ribose deacetylase (regulator of RNase III)